MLAGAGAGVLEIKCPFNRGSPEAATPPRAPAWYYMPQVGGAQGSMLGYCSVSRKCCGKLCACHRFSRP